MSRFSAVFSLGVVAWFGCFAHPSLAQQSCDSFDECTINAVCQLDGTCKGTARPNGESCDDGNPCTTNDKCQSGACHGSVPAPNGTSCTSVFSALGPCLVSASCTFGQCVPSFKTCPQTDSNNCTFDFCNPANGQCMVFTNTCQDACSTAQCDPSSGECINKQPANNGGSCDDFNDCTSNDRCSAGQCVGMGGSSGPTATRTPTPTVTPVTTVVACVGDCDGNGHVTIAEVVRAIASALGQDSAATCGLDRDQNGTITIDEIIAATNSLGLTCGGTTPTRTAGVATSTPTRTTVSTTRTATPFGPPTATPTRTSTVGGGSNGTTASRAAGMIQSSSSVLLVVPDLVTFLIGHIPQGGLKRMQLFQLPLDCPGGGSGTLACDQDIVIGVPPRFSPPVYTVQLNACKATGANGATVTLNGSLTLTGVEGQVCSTVPENATLEIQNLTVEETGSAGTVTATFSNFSAQVTLAGSDAVCTYSSITLDVGGSVTVTSKNAQGATVSSTQVSFGAGASITIEISQYGTNCVPVIYSSSLSGVATFTSGGASFQATYDPLQMTNDTSGGNSSVSVIGEVTSSCLGSSSVVLQPRANLEIDAGAACPHAGEQLVEHGNDLEFHDLIRYKATGLELDYGDDGSVDATFDSCLDPRLSVCAGS